MCWIWIVIRCPGDPYEVKELARKLGDFADDVASALRAWLHEGG
jgi:hypothetical protein